MRRGLFLACSPWTEVHGYLQCVAPRHDRSDSSDSTETSEELLNSTNSGAIQPPQPVACHRSGNPDSSTVAASALSVERWHRSTHDRGGTRRFEIRWAIRPGWYP